jgi:hypothetical protein
MMDKCGKCKNWMKKSSCPRENIGKKPSCEELACKQFVLVKWAEQSKEES